MYGAATTEAVASAVVFSRVRRLMDERSIETSPWLINVPFGVFI
jgi:hypothetical protein